MIRLSDSNQFRKFILYGLNEYSNSRIETVNCSVSFENQKDIKKCFVDFCYELGFHKWGEMKVQYCIVVVRGQHIHGFIKKPFQTPQFIRDHWQKITGEKSNVMILTLRNETKEDPVKMGKTISYFCEQSQKHDCGVEFFKSDAWGIVSKEDKEAYLRKKNKFYRPEHPMDEPIPKKKVKVVKRKFDPVVMINGIMYYESQLTDEQRALFDQAKMKKVTPEGISGQREQWEKASQKRD